VVTLHSPEEQGFYGTTLEEALGLCLVWLMAPDLGIRPFFRLEPHDKIPHLGEATRH
jgi:hypothetical protein